MMDWIKLACSDVNGIPDEARVAMLLGCLAVIGFEGWDMFMGHAFDAGAFALGYGGIVGAFGLSLKARGDN